MTKEVAEQIYNELQLNNNENYYNISIKPYCLEYNIEITEQNPTNTTMFLYDYIIKILNKYNKSIFIQNNGGGQNYMRGIVM